MHVIYFVFLIVVIILVIANVIKNTEKNQESNVTTFDNGMENYLFGKELYLFGKTDEINSVEQLEQLSEEIIIAKKISQAAPTVIYGVEDRIEIAYTLSEFKVEKIIKSNALIENQVFTILENEAYDEKVGYHYHINGYQLMTTDQDYLLFLRQSTSDPYYLIIGNNEGKVNLDNPTTDSPKEIINNQEERAQEILSEYQRQEKFRQKVKDKYGKIIEEYREK